MRRLAVLRPIKVVLTNYPKGKTEELDAINNPEDPNAGTRKSPLAASFTSSAMISWRRRRRSTFG